MKIRRYKIGEEEEIWQLFFNTIRTINISDYSAAQVEVWASDDFDLQKWQARLAIKNPFVAEIDNQIAGFAELEADGHIDCFYCHHQWQRRGIGSLLFSAIEQEAKRLDTKRLFAEVSITAKPFFLSKGFVVVKEQEVCRRDVLLTNFVMEKIIG